jgi:molybdate transport system regulatory protein
VTRAVQLPLRPRLKAWLVAGDEFLMGPRYVRLLEGIDRLGSIRAACQEVGLSYRTCLNRLRQMERVLGTRVVRTTRGGTSGGGAEVTAEARTLIRLYRGWRRELERLSDHAFREIRSLQAGEGTKTRSAGRRRPRS